MKHDQSIRRFIAEFLTTQQQIFEAAVGTAESTTQESHESIYDRERRGFVVI